MPERTVKEHGKQESDLPRSGLNKSGLEPGTLPIPDFERLKCLDASGLIAAGCIEMSLSFLKELVQSVYDTFALALKHGSFWSTGIIDRNCSPQSCRLLAIHYGDAQRLNHDAEDFDQWSGLVDLCQSGTAVITFSMILNLRPLSAAQNFRPPSKRSPTTRHRSSERMQPDPSSNFWKVARTESTLTWG